MGDTAVPLPASVAEFYTTIGLIIKQKPSRLKKPRGPFSYLSLEVLKNKLDSVARAGHLHVLRLQCLAGTLGAHFGRAEADA